MNTKIAIFASGNGSNAENIVRFFRGADCGMEVALVVCNRSDAGVVERASKLHVPLALVSKNELSDARHMVKLLDSYKVNFIVLAGFLLFVPEFIVYRYKDRILNIHPSLLPRHGGKGMYGRKVHEAVVENADTESGITIHRVDERYDSGAIVFQAKVPVAPSDKPFDVERKVRQLELTHYPTVIMEYIQSLSEGGSGGGEWYNTVESTQKHNPI